MKKQRAADRTAGGPERPIFVHFVSFVVVTARADLVCENSQNNSILYRSIVSVPVFNMVAVNPVHSLFEILVDRQPRLRGRYRCALWLFAADG